MYPVIALADEVADLTEPLGTKPKFWFQSDELGECLFKEGRPNTGDDWSEKVASELCRLLGLPHARYELATWKGRRGVISQTFVPKGGALIHGNQLMAKVVPGYPRTKTFHVHQHTLRRVLAIMRTDRISLPLGWQALQGIETALDVFIGYLLLDSWIANQDRHHENWGLVLTPGRTLHLAPSYDHASSLGANETDENRNDRLTTRDMGRSMERYVERAISAFYPSSSITKPMPTLHTFRDAATFRPGGANAWLDRIERVSSETTREIFRKVPPERITPTSIDFAQKILEINRQRLLALRS